MHSISVSYSVNVFDALPPLAANKQHYHKISFTECQLAERQESSDLQTPMSISSFFQNDLSVLFDLSEVSPACMVSTESDTNTQSSKDPDMICTIPVFEM